MIDYTLKSFKESEFNDLVVKIVERCSDAFKIKINPDFTLLDYLELKYIYSYENFNSLPNDQYLLVESLLYIIFKEYGEHVNQSDSYSNMIYNYCLGILAVNRFLKKFMEIPHEVYPAIIDFYGVNPEITNENSITGLTSFTFNARAISTSTSEHLDFWLDVSLSSSDNDWQNQIITFITDSEEFSESIKLSKIAIGFKDFWDRFKEI